jgi:ankyrin repeat protein
MLIQKCHGKAILFDPNIGTYLKNLQGIVKLINERYNDPYANFIIVDREGAKQKPISFSIPKGPQGIHSAISISLNDERLFYFLKENGVDFYSSNLTKTPWLLMAAKRNNKQSVEMLINAGFDPNQKASDTGATALHIASEYGFIDTIKLLLKYGAEVNAASNNKMTALFLAAQGGHEKAVSLLLKNGAEPDLAGVAGMTPLYRAVQNGHHKVVNQLLEAGANPNLIKNDGTSVLLNAIKRGYFDIAKDLLAAGASPSLGKGLNNPLNYAKQMRLTDMASLLDDYISGRKKPVLKRSATAFFEAGSAVPIQITEEIAHSKI